MAPDERFMIEACRLARESVDNGLGGPFGAVIVKDGQIVARGQNRVLLTGDPTAHAEVLALRRAVEHGGEWRLEDTTLVVTLEPCPMCAGAIVHARLRRVIFGCSDTKGGAAGGLLNILQMPELNHQCEITRGVLSDKCASLLKEFFAARRKS